MTGLLKDADMDQMETWIGTGDKMFTLLYSITRDGCAATTFHQKCDNKGPTVTVLYNQQGSVYGGYTGVSWNRSGTYQNDETAFLFQLRFNKKPSATKFTSSENGNDVYLHSSYGPAFGGDQIPHVRHRGRKGQVYGFSSVSVPIHVETEEVYYGHLARHNTSAQPVGTNFDFCTFTGTVNKSGGYYRLNGYIDIRYSYDNYNEISMDEINNGNMNVTNLEVYSVTNGKRKKAKQQPWRKTQTWNEKFLDGLMEDIISFKPIPDLDVSETSILMLGPVGAGKSSFYNTINSIFRGRITQKAGSGCAEQSLTTTYTPYFVRVRSGGTLNFRLCDTRGLEEGQGIDILECNYILDGHVPEYYEFNPATPITPETDGFVSKPTMEDKIHCVVFVLDSTTLEALPTKIIQKLKSFQNLMNQKGIPQAILLTKIDQLCEDVGKNVADVFLSSVVEEHVEKASQMLGLPRGNVLPVKNYENEMQLEKDISILSLLSLRQILNFAEDYMESVLDKMASTQRRRERRGKSNEKSKQ